MMTIKRFCLHEAQIRNKELFALTTERRQICTHFFRLKNKQGCEMQRSLKT
jgi:hypothetical protein